MVGFQQQLSKVLFIYGEMHMTEIRCGQGQPKCLATSF